MWTVQFHHPLQVETRPIFCIHCGFFNVFSRSLYRTFYVRYLMYSSHITLATLWISCAFPGRGVVSSPGVPVGASSQYHSRYPLAHVFSHTFTLDAPYAFPIYFMNARKGVSYCILWLKYLNVLKGLHINRWKYITNGLVERFCEVSAVKSAWRTWRRSSCPDFVNGRCHFCESLKLFCNYQNKN